MYHRFFYSFIKSLLSVCTSSHGYSNKYHLKKTVDVYRCKFPLWATFTTQSNPTTLHCITRTFLMSFALVLIFVAIQQH